MNPWKPLLVLSCLALAASTATASVLFKGLQYSPQGVCVADLDGDGHLDLSNIGSSGQDGVSVDCLHMDGMRVALDGRCSPADAGASVSLAFQMSVSGTTLSPRVRLDVVPTACTLTPDLSPLSSSSTETVTLSRAGSVVYTCTVPAGTGLSVAYDATGSCPNPALSCSVRRGSSATCTCSSSWSSSVSVTVAGHTEDCDDADFTCSLDTRDEDCDGVACDLRVSSPPGSSFSSVTCSSGACRVHDQFVQGAGAVSLDCTAPASSSSRRLEVHNLGSSGQDGVSVLRAPLLSDGSGGGGGGGSVSALFAMPSLVFDPSTDVGGSAVITIIGNSFSSSGLSAPASASIKLDLAGGTLSGLRVTCDHGGLGAQAESVAVLSHGVEVSRCAMSPGDFALVTAPPNGPPAFMVASCGAKKDFKGHVTLLKAPMAAPGFGAGRVASPDAASGDVYDTSVPMEVSFRCDRVFVIGGLPPVTGDQLVCWGGGGCSSGACPSSFVPSSTEMRCSCPSPSSSLSSLSLLDFSSSSGDQIFADIPGSTVLSSAHTCVTVPFTFSRIDATPVRAYSVTFHLSPELARCGTSVVQGDYLSRVAGTQMFVTDNGGGSYTVDCGILGAVCGATGTGTLFSLDLSAVQPPPSDVGAVTVDDVKVRDCSNLVVTGNPGGSSYVTIQFNAPPVITSLTASQVKSGNPPGGVTGIALSGLGASTKQYVDDCYRASFGNYPLYDKGSSAGQAPSPPADESSASSSGWTPVTLDASSVDSPPTRDLYYYVIFVRDAFGNVSACSNRTGGTLDYHLGDVSDGHTVCSGDNQVTLADISALGAHYGLPVRTNDPWTCLDVGPTTDFSVDGRPTVDGVLDFEDFILYAINFGAVSAPQASSRPAPALANASRLVVPALPAVGGTFDVGVVVEGEGDIQGLSARLAYDHAVLEAVGVAPGALLEQQGRASSVLSSAPGEVDAALLGEGPGIAGSGELARVTFRVKAAGDPGLGLASLVARDSRNQPVALAGALGGPGAPTHTALGFAYPNPFAQSVGIHLSLREAGAASVAVFDVAGRRVRTLVQGAQPAGTRVVTWDGRDDAGMRLAPGAYIVRLDAGGLRETRTIRLVR